MKMIVKLAVLLATLLLLTGISFASFGCADANYCECYKVTATDLTDPAGSWEKDWKLCFNFDDAHECGNIVYPTNGLSIMYLSLFFDAMNQTMAGMTASFKFHGDNLYVLTGELYCSGGDFCGTPGHRYTLRGHIEECPAP